MLVVSFYRTEGAKAVCSRTGETASWQELWGQQTGGTGRGGQALSLSSLAHPTCPSIMSRLERPKGTSSSASSLTDGKPRALEQKGLDDVQAVSAPGLPPDDEISFPISSLPTLSTAHPSSPGWLQLCNCTSSNNPMALPFHEVGLLPSKLITHIPSPMGPPS